MEIRFAEVLPSVVPVGTVLDSIAVMAGHRLGACPSLVAADDCSRDLRDPVDRDPVDPSLADTVDVEDIESAVEVHRHGLAFDDPDSHQGHRLHCLVADRVVVVAPVDHLVVLGHNLPGTAAGENNFLANVNTAAIEDCVADMVTFAVDQAYLHLAHRDLVPSCSRRACAAGVVVASDILALPFRLAVAVDPAAAVGDLRLTKRKVDDSVMLPSNDRVAAAAVIDYRDLDYYYYYLIDSVLDLELGSDYWRGAAASVNSADQLPAT